DADAGARAAMEQAGDGARIEIEAVQAGDRRAGRERELRARAKADVIRNRFFNAQIHTTIEAIALDERFEMALRARRVRALRAQALAARDRQTRARRIDGDAQAAEAAPEVAVEI